MEEDLWSVLAQMSVVECPACGQETHRHSEVCEACGAPLEQATEEASLNLMAGPEGMRPRAHKVAMEESKNLLKLKEARHDLAEGRLAVEDFAAVVEEVLVVVESGLELYHSPAMKQRLATMEEGPARIFTRVAAAAAEMQQGLYQMLSYQENSSLAQVDAGLARVEAALWKVDAAQDKALQAADEEA